MKEYKTSILQKFTKKLQKALKHLFTFVLHPKVEPTNNRAERGLRKQVVIRKIIGTLRNEKGTRIYEVITSVLTTWREKGYNLHEKLVYVL
ncbi:MAG: transposase [bacterium]